MYREFFLLIEAYLRTLDRKEAIYEIVLPMSVAAIVSFWMGKTIDQGLISSIINLMAIILGFVVATITILLTSNSQNLSMAQQYILNKKIFGKDITLFRKLVVIFFYIAFIAMLELIISILTIYFCWYGKISSFVNIFLVFHLILLSIRNLTNLFFVEFK